MTNKATTAITAIPNKNDKAIVAVTKQNKYKTISTPKLIFNS